MTQTACDPRTTAGIADAPMRLTIDIAAEAIDGCAGHVDGIVLDPGLQRVTDLVVRLHGRADDARLVPIGAVAWCGEHIVLSWLMADIDHAQPVRGVASRGTDQRPHEVELVTAGVSRTFGWSFGTVGPLLAQAALGRLATLPPTIYDAIPAGRAEVGRRSDVFSIDNHIVGHVRGLIVERDGTIANVIVGRGHLWSRRDVDVAIADVDSFVSDRVRLGIGRDVVDMLSVTAPRRHEHNRQAPSASTPRIP